MKNSDSKKLSSKKKLEKETEKEDITVKLHNIDFVDAIKLLTKNRKLKK